MGKDPDLREFMFGSATHRRKHLTTQIATVIGSAGKTSVKEMLGRLLPEAFISPANQNTKLALAWQILRLPTETTTAVFEMGARRVGDFQIPLGYLRPQVVTLLNIGTAHVGEFGSLKNLNKEKLSPLQFPEAHTLVVPADEDYILAHARGLGKKLLTFGSSPSADVHILDETVEGVLLKISNENVWMPCPLAGPAKALNIAAATATALALGAKPSEFSENLAHFHGVPRRFESFRWLGREAIDDAFNASPESMRQGILQAQRLAEGRKLLLVLGSMLELGAYTELEHRALGRFLAETFAEAFKKKNVQLVTVGTEAEFTRSEIEKQFPNLMIPHFTTAAEARPSVTQLAPGADLIYFKGSKGLQLQNIFKG